jgi:hypothetical protein
MTPDDHISALYLFNATTQADRNRIVMGSKSGGYYYIDDEDSKTRTIVLNSHEYPWVVKDDGNLKYNSSASKSVVFTYSPAQLMWFANVALDFSNKDTPTEWGALVLAHLGAWGSVEVHTIMNAFKQGTKLESFTLTDEYVTEYDGQTIEMTADYSVGARSIAFLLGEILGYDGYNATLDERYAYYENTYGITFQITGQEYDSTTGMLIEGHRQTKYFAIGYRTGTVGSADDKEVYVWRLKGTFAIPEETHATEDDGTDANGQELVYTGIFTTHKFEKNGKSERAVVIDTGLDLIANKDTFFDTVQTPDTVQAKA